MVEEERATAPDRVVEVWAFDEHRAGLKPVIRRVWAKRGQRPIAVSHPRYTWLYLYAFVHPTSGAVEWFTGSTVDTALFSAVLARFAVAVGAGPHKRILLVLDGAGWHVSADLVVPEGIRLVFLPPYTPELQPAEHLWPLTNEAVANRHFASIAELSRALARRCRALTAQPDILRANTLFHWWPKAA
jgi:DDE superfamily endonuclease